MDLFYYTIETAEELALAQTKVCPSINDTVAAGVSFPKPVLLRGNGALVPLAVEIRDSAAMMARMAQLS
jgi:hypothetical protein